MSGSRAFGPPNAAFARSDPQSDALHALLSNPYRFVTSSSTDDPLDLLAVHWSCQGALLWSFSVALCFAPAMHTDLNPCERLELAISGFILWDLWQVLSARREAQSNALTGSMSMATETVKNLQAVALNLITLLMSKGEATLTI